MTAELGELGEKYEGLPLQSYRAGMALNLERPGLSLGSAYCAEWTIERSNRNVPMPWAVRSEPPHSLGLKDSGPLRLSNPGNCL